MEVSFDSQIKHLMSLLASTEKAFRIPCTIKVGPLEVPINRRKVQADQKNDMNVISMKIVRKLCLELFNLNFIEFREFIMRTTDHKKTPLLY